MVNEAAWGFDFVATAFDEVHRSGEEQLSNALT